MRRQKRGDIEWLEFELFGAYPHFVHGIFLRTGGVSDAPFGSLNVSKSVGDSPENVSENRRRIADILGVEGWAIGHLQHGATVAQVSARDEIPLADGLMTERLNLALGVTHADCQSALFFDPIRDVFATVHCGWRGNVLNIYGKTVQRMQEVFGTQPRDLLVGIGPSLGPLSAEFIHYRTELPEIFWSYRVGPVHFDLWQISRMQLEEAGVLPKHIEIAQICSVEQASDFFSHRRDRGITGRNITLGLLKK